MSWTYPGSPSTHPSTFLHHHPLYLREDFSPGSPHEETGVESRLHFNCQRKGKGNELVTNKNLMAEIMLPMCCASTVVTEVEKIVELLEEVHAEEPEEERKACHALLEETHRVNDQQHRVLEQQERTNAALLDIFR
ncbi:hypothetical protein JB92DRAFT_3123715 [Gautieria morchelliformis]|nr:hypothetical protein JB92DRAFT_3123715 [Gautieria morchelliformis]